MDVTMWILVCSMSTAVLLAPVTTVCPYNVTACTCTGASLVCRNLNGIPALASNNTDGSITDLTFTSGKLNNITASSLPANLHSVTFFNADISSISSDAFNSSADTLTSLTMNNVNFPKLGNALLNVNNLTELKFTDVTIKTWSPNVLQHLEQTLRSVVFDNVGLTSWPEWLKNFTLVNSVDLSDNALHNISIDAFTNLKHLTNLSLGSTQLDNETNVNVALAPVSSTLRVLDLSNNLFDVIPQVAAGMSKLYMLDLSSNLIMKITSDRIPLQLTYLDVSNNPELRQLNDTSFPNGSALEILVLSKTSLVIISDLAFQPLKHLRTLHLESTSLGRIPLALTKLQNLEVLEMDVTRWNCPCPRDDRLVTWFQSQKSLKVSGNCYNYDFTVEHYLTNTTGKSPCSGYSRVTFNFLLHLFVVVLMVVLL